MIVICRQIYADLCSNVFSSQNLSENIDLIVLSKETSSMNETLSLVPDLYLKWDKLIENGDTYFTLALADSALLGESYENVYRKLLEAQGFAMMLFPTRDYQLGKLGQVSINKKNRIIDIQDKVPGCDWNLHWGMIKIPASFVQNLDPQLHHIGISIAKELKVLPPVEALFSKADYYDCGTFDEYFDCLVSLHKRDQSD